MCSWILFSVTSMFYFRPIHSRTTIFNLKSISTFSTPSQTQCNWIYLLDFFLQLFLDSNLMYFSVLLNEQNAFVSLVCFYWWCYWKIWFFLHLQKKKKIWDRKWEKKVSISIWLNLIIFFSSSYKQHSD